MKTAVLLFGDYRHFDKASISLEYFKYIDADFFVSTWDKTMSYDVHLNTYTEFITEYRINRLLPRNAVFQSIEDEDRYLNLSRTEKMIRHWKVLGEALRKSSNDYDCICLLRIDLYIDSFRYDELVKESQSNKLHVGFGGWNENEEGQYSVSDVSYSGKTETILKYIDMLPIAPIASHTDFGCILKYSNIELENQKSINGLLVRPLTASFLGEDPKSNEKFLKGNFENVSMLNLIYNNWLHGYSYGNSKTLSLKNFIKYFKEHINNFKIEDYEQ